jgi:hypothetical protein
MSEFLNLNDFDTILDLKAKHTYTAIITKAEEQETEYGMSIVLNVTVPQDKLPPELATVAHDGITKIHYGFAFPRVGVAVDQRKHNQYVATRKFVKDVLGLDPNGTEWTDLSNWENQTIQISIGSRKGKSGEPVTFIESFSRIK